MVEYTKQCLFRVTLAHTVYYIGKKLPVMYIVAQDKESAKAACLGNIFNRKEVSVKSVCLLGAQRSGNAYYK